MIPPTAILLLPFTAGFCASIFAQKTRATLTGTLTDSTGAVVACVNGKLDECGDRRVVHGGDELRGPPVPVSEPAVRPTVYH